MLYQLCEWQIFFFLVFDLFVHVLRSFSKSGSSSFSLSSFLFILLFLDHAFAVAGFPGVSIGKESACNAGDLCLTPGWEDPLEKRMAIHSSILA